VKFGPNVSTSAGSRSRSRTRRTDRRGARVRLRAGPGSPARRVVDVQDVDDAGLDRRLLNLIISGPGEDEQTARIARDVMPAVRSATSP